MANTYTQVHIQSIFAVKSRAGLIGLNWENELFKYITGIVQAYNHKLIVINGMPDHLHVLFGMRPTQSLSDLMQDIKGSSSKWINDRKLVKGHFEWQEACLPYALAINVAGRGMEPFLIANQNYQG